MFACFMVRVTAGAIAVRLAAIATPVSAREANFRLSFDAELTI